MALRPERALFPAWATFFTDPRYRRFHAALLVVGLAAHLILHYATYIPALRPVLGGLPYFRLHVLHEAEFLLFIAYASIVFGLRGGLAAVTVTAVTSVPFILTPYIFGRTPAPGEVRDLTTQVLFVLGMGVLMTLLYETEARRRRVVGQVEALQQADRLKTSFISIASHELRTPLSALYGFSELLLRRSAPEEQRRAWTEHIYHEARRLTTIVDELLSVSRIQSGALRVRRERVTLGGVVQEALRSLGVALDRHTVEVDLAEEVPAVLGDADKLAQVLLNLLSNAVKYSPSGGLVTVTARHEPERGRVVVSVSDQGVGISPEDQAQLFTTFHRIQRPETAHVEGTGLGLYIVKALVELMGGEVGVRSALGRGSTFWFTVPVWRPEPSTAEARPAPATLS